MSTINDVAQRAGVSVTTVSHALSGKRPVAPRTRTRIMAAVEQLNYQPSQLAIAMLTGRTMTLGALVPDIMNPFFGELLSSVESAANSKGYGTIVASTELQQDQEQRQIELLCAKKVDALLLIGCSDHAVDHVPTEPGGPTAVIVDQIPDGLERYPKVCSDQEGGGRLAADHLWELGHRMIGVIAGPPELSVAAARLRGFLSQMRMYRSPVPTGRRTSSPSFTLAAGQQAARALLQSRPEVTALFCANDLIAFGALHAASELGRTVPDELSVVGFDDIFVSSMVQPTLTTIRQDIGLLGRRAVDIAVRALAGETIEAPERLAVTLVARASTTTAPTGTATAGTGSGRRR
jgi:DNA-binding LacI/PurR family transcriptional regulator